MSMQPLQQGVQPLPQPLSEAEKLERRFNKDLVNESLKGDNQELTQKIMEIVIAKIPSAKKGEFYTLNHLLKDVESLVFVSDSQKMVDKLEEAEDKTVDLCAALGKKLNIAQIDLMLRIDDLIKAVDDWDILDTTSKASKDKQLLQEAQDLINKINGVRDQFVAWKGEIKGYLKTSETNVPAISAFNSILDNYNTQYIDVSKQKIIPYSLKKQKFNALLEQRIKEDFNVIPSEEEYKTIAATHEVSVSVLKNNISKFHKRTEQCKVLKQQLEEASNNQAHETTRFIKYYKYLEYCVKNKCYYGKMVVAFFETGYFVGKYNHIDRPIAVSQQVNDKKEEESASDEEGKSSSSSSISTTQSNETELHLDGKQAVKKQRLLAVQQRESFTSNPTPRDNISLDPTPRGPGKGDESSNINTSPPPSEEEDE